MATVQDGVRYAERVVAGEIIACKWTILACRRFLDDLEHGPERGVYFDEGRAQHVLDFYQFVPHVKGRLTGQSIELMDWHTFILINMFGFVIVLIDELTSEPVLDDDGDPVMVRRFRTAYNEVARKNAKSTLSSGVGLYMTGADAEGGAEVYSAATTRDQARIVFEDAKNMIKKSKLLKRLFGFNKLNIHQERTASKFEPLSSDANNLDGLNIHCGIVDELHAHRTRDVWDVLETATGARTQPLILGITTAGFNREGICYEIRDYSTKVLSGVVEDDSFFAIIFTLDEGDDPWDEANWPKANPGLGICKRWDDLRRLAKKARAQVAARTNFLTKHLNIWVQSESSWMDMARWLGAGRIDPPEQLQQLPLWVGIDLSNKIDVAAAIKVWQEPDGSVQVASRFWLPEGRIESAPKHIAELYRKWADAGYLELTDGEVIDHLQIKEELIEWVAGESLREVGHDPWSATQFALALMGEGVPVVEVPQTVKNLSEAMKETEGLVKGQRIRHDHNPVMNWMMANVVCKVDNNGNYFPRKATAEAKIDGPVGLFTAMSRLIVGGGEGATSIYDQSDVLC